MRSKSFAILSAFVALAAASAYAETRLRADIPFDFQVGSQSLPAGKYSVTLDTGRNLLRLDCIDQTAAAAALTIAKETNRRPEEAKLVFHRYDNSYFLSQVWSPGNTLGRELMKSKAEKEMAKKVSEGEAVIPIARR